MKRTSIISGICLLISSTSFGQTISTDAPSMTPGSEVVTPRVFQYEGRLQYTTSYSNRYLDIPLNLFRIGLTKRLEFRTVNGFQWIKTYSPGFTSKVGNLRPIELGAKYGIFANPDSRFKMAALVHYTLPKPNAVSKFHSGYAALTMSHSLNERSSLSYSFNFTYSQNTKADDGLFGQTTTLCYGNQISPRLNLFAEVYSTYTLWTYDYLENGDIDINFDAGAYYWLRDNIQIDYTFGYGATSDMLFHSLGFDIMIAPKKN